MRSWVKRVAGVLVLLVGLLSTASCGMFGGDAAVQIKFNAHSEYAKTFSELSVGDVFDFRYKSLRTDIGPVYLWVEGYSNGVKMDPFHVLELSFQPTAQDNKGRLGFCIIQPYEASATGYLYVPGLRNGFELGGVLSDKFAKSSYQTLGDGYVKLKQGETKLLAVIRQGKGDGTMLHYEVSDEKGFAQMLEADSTILLFKMRVGEAEEDEA